MRLVVASVCIACGIASAAPNAGAREKYNEARKLAADDDDEKALALVDQGLAIAPKDLELLQLRGVLLLKARDYASAYAAYQAYLDAGASGANKREAQKIVNSLRAVKSTFVDLTANTDATIYLDTKTAGAFCTAPCKKALLPGDYKVIAERTGFDRYVSRITVADGKTTEHAIAMQEKPSALSIRITPAGAAITIDGKPHDGAATIPAGKHALEVKLAGHATHRHELAAHEGKPVDLEVGLVPLVPFEASPPAASVMVDDKPAVLEAGGIAIPPGAHVIVASAPRFHPTRIEVPAERTSTYKIAVVLREVGTLVELAGAPAGAKILVDGKVVGTTPLREPLEVAPGKHSVEIKVSGYRPYRTTGTFVTDQRARLAVGKLRRDDRRRTMYAGAATGVSLVAGAAFSFLALSRESDYDARARLPGITPDDPELSSMKSSGKRFSLLADIGFGLAIAGIGVTTYLFTHEGRGESEGSLRIGIGPAGATASIKF
ncbi:MAG: PEGA domain-containing protein [Deltaproteobacteria bacterium]|nr:PEGA domain-containing protein [Deltaproteobacteria bacterium]